MRLWNAHLLIGCEPQRDLRFEIFAKLNSVPLWLELWYRLLSEMAGTLSQIDLSKKRLAAIERDNATIRDRRPHLRRRHAPVVAG
jgi:hypothetical protein